MIEVDRTKIELVSFSKHVIRTMKIEYIHKAWCVKKIVRG